MSGGETTGVEHEDWRTATTMPVTATIMAKAIIIASVT